MTVLALLAALLVLDLLAYHFAPDSRDHVPSSEERLGPWELRSS
jgi:hypothetical protein